MSKSEPPQFSEEQIREIVRDEALSVYDGMTVVDEEGKKYSVTDIQNRINSVAPNLTRRESLKTALLAFTYISLGAGLTTGILKAISQPAQADATGQIGTSSDPLESVITENINNVEYVAPGDSIQTDLDNAASRPSAGQPIFNVVRLYPNELYTENVVVKDDTILHLNGANLTQAANGDPLVDLQGDNCRLAGPGYLQPLSGFTADSILVDTSNFSEALREQNQNTVGVWPPVHIRTSASETSTGLRLKAESHAISTGNRFGVIISNPQNHIVLETNNGNFINNVVIWYIGDTGCFGKAISHVNNTGASGAAFSLIRGFMQGESDATHGIHNETSESSSIRFEGLIFDPGQYTTAAIAGPGIRSVVPTIGTPNPVTFGTGTTVNGVSHQSLSGSSPDATNWVMGDVVMDTDNAGDAYFIYDNSASGGVTQIGT